MQPMIDDPCKEDQLGRNEAVDALAHMINAIDFKSNSSFTIGIFGEWGTGKTSMLRQIEAKLKDDSSNSPLIVWFNPWQYSEDDNIVAALFLSVADAIGKQANSEKNDAEKLLESAGKVASTLKNAATAFIARGELSVSIPFFAEAKLSGTPNSPVSENRDKKIDPTNKLENAYSSLYFDVLSSISSLASDLQGKIVVLIDDLDRCDDHNIIKLFDGMKVFFDLPNFVFVVGAARAIVRAALRKKTASLDLTENSIDELSYLDKIIQFSYVIPPPDPDLLKKNLVAPILDRYDIDPCYSGLIVDIIDKNPRSLKRVLNHFIFTHFVLEQRLRDKPVAGLVLKASLISYKYPAFFAAIQQFPNELRKFEGKVKEVNTDSETGDPRSIFDTGNSVVAEAILHNTSIDLYNILSFRIEEENFIGLSNLSEYLFGSSIGELDDIIASTIPAAAQKSRKTRSAMEGFKKRFVPIPPLEQEIGNKKDGKFNHKFTSALLVDRYPMTSDVFYQFMPELETSSEPGIPVTGVSWRDAVKFCNKLSERYGLDLVYEGVDDQKGPNIFYQNNGFRLLTEAEWESIARDGALKDTDLAEQAWYSANAMASVQPVGTKLPNKFDLYDLLGNVWEWVNDWHGKYPTSDSINWHGPNSGWEKVARGGSWASFSKQITADYRGHFDVDHRSDNIGFRICRISTTTDEEK